MFNAQHTTLCYCSKDRCAPDHLRRLTESWATIYSVFHERSIGGSPTLNSQRQSFRLTRRQKSQASSFSKIEAVRNLRSGHYGTSRKDVGSIPDEVAGFFNRANPSNRIVALESAQPLSEMSTVNLPGAMGQRVHMADNLTAISDPTV
jgi:hypothetical protein